MAINANDDSFQGETGHGLVLVDYWAEWCGPCKMLSPIVEEMPQDFAAEGLKAVKVNVDEAPATAKAAGIRGLPTLVLMKDGKPLASKTGSASKSAVSDWIRKALQAA